MLTQESGHHLQTAVSKRGANPSVSGYVQGVLPGKYIVLALGGLLAVSALILAGRSSLAAQYQPMAVPNASFAQVSTATQTATATSTAAPGAITWVDQMVLMPNTPVPSAICVTPTANLVTPDASAGLLCNTQYVYLPPQWVIDQLRVNFDQMLDNYRFQPNIISDKVGDTYVYADASSTPTATPGANVNAGEYLGTDKRTFTFVGCAQDGSLCEIHDLWQQNFIYHRDTNLSMVHDKSYPDVMTTYVMKWDGRDSRWKYFTSFAQYANYMTATP